MQFLLDKKVQHESLTNLREVLCIVKKKDPNSLNTSIIPVLSAAVNLPSQIL